MVVRFGSRGSGSGFWKWLCCLVGVGDRCRLDDFRQQCLRANGCERKRMMGKERRETTPQVSTFIKWIGQYYSTMIQTATKASTYLRQRHLRQRHLRQPTAILLTSLRQLNPVLNGGDLRSRLSNKAICETGIPRLRYVLGPSKSRTPSDYQVSIVYRPLRCERGFRLKAHRGATCVRFIPISDFNKAL